MMQVILLERVESLGQMGDVVKVRPGYARNFLLPKAKALRATAANISHFEAQKKVLEAENLKKKAEAEKVAAKMEGLKVVLIRQASEAGHLYGSVSGRDIAEAVTTAGFKTSRTQVRMLQAYKQLGLFPIKIDLHPEVAIEVTINVARSADEAVLQEERGGALIVSDEADEEKAQPEAAPEEEAEEAPEAEAAEEDAA